MLLEYAVGLLHGAIITLALLVLLRGPGSLRAWRDDPARPWNVQQRAQREAEAWFREDYKKRSENATLPR